jgi:hypothetical protein
MHLGYENHQVQRINLVIYVKIKLKVTHIQHAERMRRVCHL